MVQSAAPPDGLDAFLARAARAALGWGLMEASRRAGVSVAGVLAVEGKGLRPAPSIAPDRLRRAYEEAGVSFLDGPGGRGIRVLLR